MIFHVVGEHVHVHEDIQGFTGQTESESLLLSFQLTKQIQEEAEARDEMERYEYEFSQVLSKIIMNTRANKCESCMQK